MMTTCLFFIFNRTNCEYVDNVMIGKEIVSSPSNSNNMNISSKVHGEYIKRVYGQNSEIFFLTESHRGISFIT